MCDMTINIYGGNNRFCPTPPRQYKTSMSMIMPTSCRSSGLPATRFLPRQKKLSRYIDKDHIPEHLNKIRACNNATDLGQVVVSLLDQEPKLTEETIVKESFIQCLLPFAINITTGRSVNNIRARINDALEARHRSRP